MAGDPHWDKVVLAMHMDGANASTVFTDLKGKTVTAVGNAQISTAQSKFGGASALFDGAGDYLVLPNSTDFDVLSNDFTIDFWVRLNTVGVSQGIMSGHNLLAGQVPYLIYLVSGELRYYASSDAATWNVASGVVIKSAVVANTWYHVAVSRSGGEIRLFCDGVLSNTVPVTGALMSIGVNTPSIGKWANSNYLNGYIDDLRITKGVARYTANFTPPTQAFSNAPAMISGTTKDANGAFAPRAVRVYRKSDGTLSGAATSHATTGAFAVPALDATLHYAIAHDTDADPYWDKVVLATHFDTDSVIDPYMSSVVLGLHMDGANGSTVFQDVTGKTVTAVGNAQISTTQSKFGGSSALFDGAGDYLTVPDSADVEFGSGDFTVEAWVHLNGYSAGYSGVYVSNIVCKSSAIQFYLQGTASSWTNVSIGINNGGTWNLFGPGTALLTNGKWHHIAWVRSAGTARCYVGGVATGAAASFAHAQANNANPLTVGGWTDVGYQYYLNGYIDDLRITKGVARYTANFTPPTVPFSSFKDLTGKDLMVNGVLSISTATKKYGGGALAVTGGVSGIFVPHNSGFDFGTGDFTVELWVYVSALASRVFIGKRLNAAGLPPWIIGMGATGIPFGYLNDGTNWYTLDATAPLTVSTWTHIASVRKLGVLYLFINGVSVGKTLSVPVALASNSASVHIGTDGDGLVGPVGYIDDLRITNGVARYQSDFTPPERAFPGAMGAGTHNALIFDDLTPV